MLITFCYYYLINSKGQSEKYPYGLTSVFDSINEL